MTRRNLCMMIACFVLLLLPAAGRVIARGHMAPPPPFMGGNVGAWLGSGPLTGLDNPIGPGFGDPLPDPGTGGDGFFWDPDPHFGEGGTGGNTGPGCQGTCLRPTYTGPCKYLCECYYENPDDTSPNKDITPKSGDLVNGRCIDVGGGNNLGGCVDENASCSFRIP